MVSKTAKEIIKQQMPDVIIIEEKNLNQNHKKEYYHKNNFLTVSVIQKIANVSYEVKKLIHNVRYSNQSYFNHFKNRSLENVKIQMDNSTKEHTVIVDTKRKIIVGASN